jgi:hypothetical protein
VAVSAAHVATSETSPELTTMPAEPLLVVVTLTTAGSIGFEVVAAVAFPMASR